MDPIITTPRLKLIRLTKAERESPEFEWLHRLHSNEKSMFWMLGGTSDSVEKTEALISNYLPADEEASGSYRAVYTVHRIDDEPSEFIGIVTICPLDSTSLPLPESLTIPATEAATTLTVEVAYSYLPAGWGKGYATESINAVFERCRRARSFWLPFTKLYVRAIVNHENWPSLRVMEKTGMVKRGVHEWRGKAVFVGGRWREQDTICIFGQHLFGGADDI
ncbi:TPA_exp: Uncharacterized protein A8136_1402 [Trichophyton benhamiae CBS 112371]|uniref:N-acetyltransferase domain-containing protein n=1 Tax=Arthroderma benhamiae (strain ATCC MYA-4681 / CBS 112371) TaxID=663331 RepID=D4AW53_ARTBC|nr:uncharacterized protein ARB_00418 [Trichophyton benhamiae CBS 112371]EFE32593.1 hypothetical protein ARB_00418 [Trichophyton benhamiae CBS 112371]DAA75680.1 TPA_exp: Uncharacterized protein A8136_1402 [Trichophyton benhamiae CBS 112371]